MNKYEICAEIKRGAFGVIYKGFVKKNREPIAIKIDHSQVSTLQHEVRMIQYLYMANVRNIPSVYWFGMHEEKPSLVMTFYECSLYDYVQLRAIESNRIEDAQGPFISARGAGILNENWCNKAAMILVKVIDIFENIHKHFVLHRDIKPQNFMIKDGDIYLIDFGLSMFYINENGEHYPDRPSDTMIGSPNYASIHIHNGHRYSRRDDMIALGYLYLFLMQTPITSDGLPEEVESDIPIIHIMHPNNQVLKIKKEMPNLRTKFSTTQIKYYMEYTYSIEYDEVPKYDPMKLLFMN